MNDSSSPNNYNPVYPPQPNQPPQPQPGFAPQQPGYQPVQPNPYQQAGQPMPAHQMAPGYQAPQYSQHDKKIPDRKSVATKSIELVYVLLIAMEALMAMRFVFKLLGADRDNGFILFLYRMTELFVAPFNGIFSYSVQNRTGAYGFEAEWTILVAMGVYAILAFLVVKLIDLFR